MRKYIAKIKIPSDLINLSVGKIGEEIFERWFNSNFQDESIFKQKADRDYEKIDFACCKGFTYQVKTAKHNTYTFNCDLEDIREHLKANTYVFIQLINDYAYIEDFYNSEYVLNNIKKSYKYENSFVWTKNLLQHDLDLK
jgi:hypothetical protein